MMLTLPEPLVRDSYVGGVPSVLEGPSAAARGLGRLALFALVDLVVLLLAPLEGAHGMGLPVDVVVWRCRLPPTRQYPRVKETGPSGVVLDLLLRMSTSKEEKEETVGVK